MVAAEFDIGLFNEGSVNRCHAKLFQHDSHNCSLAVNVNRGLRFNGVDSDGNHNYKIKRLSFSSITESSQKQQQSQDAWLSHVLLDREGLSAEVESTPKSSRVEDSGSAKTNRKELEREVVSLLKACAEKKDLQQGTILHDEIVEKGLLSDNIYVWSTLLHMYAKCGALGKAEEVFEKLPKKNVVAWTALISGFAEHGFGEKALQYFRHMKREGISPNQVTFMCILKACGSIKAIMAGEEIHCQLIEEGWLESNVLVGNALVDMYIKCREFARAQKVFDEMPVRDVVSWNVLIAGYANEGYSEEALNRFEQMRSEGLCADIVTYMCILKACASSQMIRDGEQIHAEIIRDGMQTNVLVGTALVDMYAKCGLLEKAQIVFDDLPVRNVVSWTALITGYGQQGHAEMALKCLEDMLHEGILPNAVTFVSVLKSCGSIGEVGKGQEIHAEIARQGLLKEDCLIGTTLVDMYCKCGLLTKAQEVFDGLTIQNIVSWTVLISGYSDNGNPDGAVQCFQRMQCAGFSANEVTYLHILKACGSIGAIDKGEEIHLEIISKGLIEKDALVGTALVDMYAKCGALAKAKEVFDELPIKNAASWNVIMAGYSQAGEDAMVFMSFNDMIKIGLEPNLATFALLLKTCSHSGLVDKGEMYFQSMVVDYSLTPELEHCTSMVDLYGRAGYFDRLITVINEMPVPADLALWHTVLASCQKWQNVKLAIFAFDCAIQLDEKDAACYVCMSNIYAAAGMLEDAKRIEAMRVKREAWKDTEYSLWMNSSECLVS